MAGYGLQPARSKAAKQAADRKREKAMENQDQAKPVSKLEKKKRAAILAAIWGVK